MNAKPRRDMNPEYLWDLTPIFKSADAWREAFDEADRAVKALSDIPGTLVFDAEHLADGLNRINHASQLAEKVYDYAFLCKSGDNSSPEYQEMEARAISLLVALETATAFVKPEILQIPKEMLDIWMEREELKTYRHMIDDVTRSRSHTLDAHCERLLAMLGDAAQTPGNTFDMFESVDMQLPSIKNEAGETGLRGLLRCLWPVYQHPGQRLRRLCEDELLLRRRPEVLRCLRGGAVQQQRARGAVRHADRRHPRGAAHHARLPGAAPEGAGP